MSCFLDIWLPSSFGGHVKKYFFNILERQMADMTFHYRLADDFAAVGLSKYILNRDFAIMRAASDRAAHHSHIIRQ